MTQSRRGISIIICCYNSVHRLPETLAHLKAQKLTNHIPWEVIVVDNASSDGTGEVAQALWEEMPGVPFQVVFEAKPGLMNARVKGFESAQFEFISFIDDDNWVSENWVETVYEKMCQYPQAGAIGGRSEPVFQSEPPDWFKNYHENFAVGMQAEKEMDITTSRSWLWGSGLIIRKRAWITLSEERFEPFLSGRKGDQLTTGEDVELCFRLILNDWKLIYVPSLHLQHYIESKRLIWKYLCKLMQRNGQADIYLNIYRRLLRNVKTSSTTNGWYKPLLLLLINFLKKPRNTILALRWKGEGQHCIAMLHYQIGLFIERIHLLWRIKEIEEGIEERFDLKPNKE